MKYIIVNKLDAPIFDGLEFEEKDEAIYFLIQFVESTYPKEIWKKLDEYTIKPIEIPE